MEPSDPRIPPKYYVGGEIPSGALAFGRACQTYHEAIAICKQRHQAGFRKLRIYRYSSGQYCRFNIRYGAGPWHSPSKAPQWLKDRLPTEVR
jgi:hypothetical protein